MVKHKVLVMALFFGFFAGAENAPQQAAPSVNPTQPNPPASTNNIKIFDDGVFNVGGGTYTPETRKSNNGTSRYLDKDKELDYNSEQRARWLKSCESLRDTDPKGFGDCVKGQKAKELSGRTNFGAREPRSGADGLNAPAASPRSMDGIRPTPATGESEAGKEPESEIEDSGSSSSEE